MSTPIRVLVTDDHAVVREGIRHVLSADAGFVVVAEAASVASAITLAAEHAPDVVVLDISLPDGSGLSAIEQVLANAPAARILMLSIHDHEQYVLESVRAGAHGYLRKDSSPAQLREAVRAVHAGANYFSEGVAAQLANAVRNEATQDDSARRFESLSARERAVLSGVVRGLTNKEIASELEISPRTVETHRENLMRKLDIRTVAGLTRFAVEHARELK